LLRKAWCRASGHDFDPPDTGRVFAGSGCRGARTGR